MIPRTLSATSLTVAEKCMARWKAQYYDRVSSPGGTAASLGTTCHSALETYVKYAWMCDDYPREFPILEAMYRQAFGKDFGHDLSVPEYSDGLDMLKRWYKRTDLTNVNVLSAESKEHFMVPTSAGDIRFNFIMDRLDEIGEDEYEVVDYKSQRFPVSTEELKKRIQARAYALATQIKYKNAKKIWVQFDLLRHDPVSVSFNRDDNIATWNYLKNIAQFIVDTPPTAAKATINSECRFCPIKATCATLHTNIKGGGTHSLDIEDVVALYDKLNNQKAGIDSLQDELEEAILKYGAEHEVVSWEEGGKKVDIAQRNTRGVKDPEAVIDLLPDEVVKRYGKVGVTAIDSIIKGKEVDDETAKKLRSLVVRTPGKIGVTVKS